MGNKLPVLIQHHKPWSDLVLRFNGGIIVDFKTPDYTLIYNQLINNTFYKDFIPKEFQWETYEETLNSLISDLI